jgi:hypothetical protein
MRNDSDMQLWAYQLLLEQQQIEEGETKLCHAEKVQPTESSEEQTL